MRRRHQTASAALQLLIGRSLPRLKSLHRSDFSVSVAIQYKKNVHDNKTRMNDGMERRYSNDSSSRY